MCTHTPTPAGARGRTCARTHTHTRAHTDRDKREERATKTGQQVGKQKTKTARTKKPNQLLAVGRKDGKADKGHSRSEPQRFFQLHQVCGGQHRHLAGWPWEPTHWFELGHKGPCIRMLQASSPFWMAELRLVKAELSSWVSSQTFPDPERSVQGVCPSRQHWHKRA